jgi:hypothetical protein
MNKDISLACLSESDMQVLQHDYHFQKLAFIPCFIPWSEVNGKQGRGDYCLYHGNLSVSENNEAALWLIDAVFSKIDAPLLVAGKGISGAIFEKARKHANVRLINNPTIAEIDSLVQEAQINVLPSFNNTGVKLKLLNALLNGRHCITNTNGVKGSRINGGVIVHDMAESWTSAINRLMHKEFSAAEKEERSAVLALHNNKENAQRLSALCSHYP